MSKVKVHIISHTHWDREWFLPAEYTSPWLVSFFDKLFSLLKEHKDYKFVLDGQVQILEDYLSELPASQKEEKKKLLRKYIEEGRLFVGPYWAQIDWQIPGAESLVRNILLAHEYTKKYGKKMDVGWLPDTFGQVGQVPQIHRLSGIDGVFVWRGVEFPDDDVHSEFAWSSPDGSKVLSVYFLASYRNLMGLTMYPEIADARVKNEVEKIAAYLTTNNAFLMNGYDLDNSPEYPLSVIHREGFPEYEIFQSDPKTYIDAVKESVPSLVSLTGELLSGRYLSVFPGKLSTRAYLKVENYLCENFLSRVLEPIGVFSWLFSGFYPREKINELWKELIINEIHDNISGVGVDQIHIRMEKSYALIMKREYEILEETISHILPSLKNGKWVVFNTLPFSVTTSVRQKDRLYKLEGLPPMGFKVLDELSSYLIEKKREEKNDFSWENDYYEVSVTPFGTLDLYDKRTGKRYDGIGFFLDEGDEGDEYNWSPKDPNSVISSLGQKVDITLTEITPVSASLEFKCSMTNPQGEDIFLRYEITFDDTPLIKYSLHIENRARDHRLKIVFPLGMKNAKIIAHMPFEYVERPEFIDNSRPIPERFSRIFIGARECEKDYEFPMGDFVALTDDRGMFAVLPRGLKEYEVHEGDLHLTLIRSVGWISNGEIKTRTGDAGPLMYTPGAQCIGEFDVEFSLYVGPETPYDKEFRYWKGIYHTPTVIVFKEGETKGKIDEFSLFETEDVEITGVKLSEDESGIIIRGFNPYKEKEIEFFVPGERIRWLNLLEEPMEKANDSKACIISPFEIFTLKLLNLPEKNSSKETNFSVIFPFENKEIYKGKKFYREEDINYLKKIKKKLKEEINTLEEELLKKKGAEYHKTLFKILSKRRTYLEVTLSILLNEELFLPEGEARDRIREEIKKVGTELNSARIKRRAYEYVLDYYLHNE